MSDRNIHEKLEDRLLVRSSRPCRNGLMTGAPPPAAESCDMGPSRKSSSRRNNPPWGAAGARAPRDEIDLLGPHATLRRSPEVGSRGDLAMARETSVSWG